MEKQPPEALFDRLGGVFPLRPNYVRRLYEDGGRLQGDGKTGSTLRRKDGFYCPERWICSTSTTMNVPPIAGEGLSRLAIPGRPITLADLIQAMPDAMLGAQRARGHGPEFRVLIKILDGAEPIPFQFHAADLHVRKHPELFPGQRFGKEEAYHFLEAPKGPVPYTHVGLRPDVTLKELKRAIAAGGDYLAELSPMFLQRFGQGFHVPAGLLHRPGTALTLEIQEPSDVYVLLENMCAGRKLKPQEQHPGFPQLEQSLRFCDLRGSRRPDVLETHRLVPMATDRSLGRGNTEEWIFPPNATKHFSGKRLRLRTPCRLVESDPIAILIWRGSGSLGGRPFNAGDEFFIAQRAASQGVAVRVDESVEMYCLFPAALK